MGNGNSLGDEVDNDVRSNPKSRNSATGEDEMGLEPEEEPLSPQSPTITEDESPKPEVGRKRKKG